MKKIIICVIAANAFGNAYGLEAFDCVSSSGKKVTRYDGAAWSDPNCVFAPSPMESQQISERANLKCKNNQCKLRIKKAGGGFITNGTINGVQIRMLIDTGATVTALSPALAKVVRINYSKEIANSRVSTVAGDVNAIRVDGIGVNIGTLPSFSLPVFITPTMNESHAILGQDYLKNMSASITGNVMEITFSK